MGALKQNKMAQYKEFNAEPFKLSILTCQDADNGKNEKIITGYSKMKLERGDTISVKTKGNRAKVLVIDQELERRDAVGNFTKTDPENLWFSALCSVRYL